MRTKFGWCRDYSIKSLDAGEKSLAHPHGGDANDDNFNVNIVK